MSATTTETEEKSKLPGERGPLWYSGRIALYVWKEALLVAIFVLAVFFAPFMSGLMIQLILDYATGQAAAFEFPWLLFIVWLAADLGAGIIGIAMQYVAGIVVPVVLTLMRQNIFRGILKHPGARSIPIAPGEALSRFRDDIPSVAFFLLEVILNVAEVTALLIALVILFAISPMITLLVVLPLIIVITLFMLAKKRVERYREANQEAISAVTGLLGEVFGAILAVKVARTEPYIVKRFRNLGEERRTALLKDQLMGQVLNAFSSHIANLGTGLLLLLAVQSMRDGQFTIGEFALFVAYMREITNRMLNVTSRVLGYQRMVVSLKRLFKLQQDEKPESMVEHTPTHLRGPLPPVVYAEKSEQDILVKLEASELTYRYPDTEKGIENIDLCIEPGKLTVVTGRIGSGKTTLLRVLLGLLPKESGEIRWNGQPVHDPASFFVPPRSAYTPQVPRLFSLTLKENLLLGFPQERADIQAALHAAVLDRDIGELEEGLETKIGPRGIKLSGGQIQRAAAARMFVRDAELLVVDDLSSALDVETEQVLWERLNARSVTCLAVSHRRTALQRADHIIVLKDGQVESQGSLQALLKTSPEMQSIWDGKEGENSA